ncbi:MAG: DUF5906 domain-containing protein [Sphaerochaeta sp.]|jgi:hypothetical protein
MNQTNQDKQLSSAPAIKDSLNWQDRVRPTKMQEFWNYTIGRDLEDDETIRITGSIPVFDKANQKFKISTKTFSDQIRNVDQLLDVIQKAYNSTTDQELKKGIGFSMNAGVFRYVAPYENDDGKTIRTAPNKEHFKGIRRFVLDVDAHAHNAGKERFHFNSYIDLSRRHIAMHVLNVMNRIMSEHCAGTIFKPSHIFATGGGLQFIIDFDRELLPYEAEEIFTFFKSGLSKLKDRIAIWGYGFLQETPSCYLEFDLSSCDIIHTQRIGGTVNPKDQYFGSFSEEIEDFYNNDKLDQLEIELRDRISNSELNDKVVQGALQNISFNIKELKNLINNANILEVSKILSRATINNKSTETFNKGDEALFNTPQDFEILKKIPDTTAQRDYMEKLILSKDSSAIIERNSSYTTYKCPFHQDNNASFAIYENKGRLASIARDFHEGNDVYNIITFTMKFLDMPRASVIQKLAVDFGFTLNKSERKSFDNDRTEQTVEELIGMVDTESKIYYRLANKNRSCIMREFEDGESFMFDGTRMMTEHILTNQLKVKNADLALRALFHDKFCEKVLINAFEEFIPGKPHTFERKGVRYVNLWIPGKEYLAVHERAKNMDELDLESSMNLIKETLPTMWYYVNQITQKGSLPYFINWLAAQSKFEVMPIIPIFSSVQGTGKGLFSETILNYYFSKEYINTASSDKIMSNFNNYMGTSSLVVLDEGTYSTTKEMDNLKNISGNSYINLEKKGVDSYKTRRYFNFIMFTNSECPARHESEDRRLSYYRLDVTLKESSFAMGWKTIDDLVLDIKTELLDFWAIIYKTKLKKEWCQNNIKNNQFNRQILLMHSFGELVIKLVENDWDNIKLQMNENIDDAIVMSNNIQMLDNIKESFDRDGSIDLVLINKYIKSSSNKNFLSVQQFIKMNQLELNGITKRTVDDQIRIIIDRDKVKKLITTENNLANLMPEYSNAKIKDTLYENRKLRMENVKQEHIDHLDYRKDNEPEIYNGLIPEDENPLIHTPFGSVTAPAIHRTL